MVYTYNIVDKINWINCYHSIVYRKEHKHMTIYLLSGLSQPITNFNFCSNLHYPTQIYTRFHFHIFETLLSLQIIKPFFHWWKSNLKLKSYGTTWTNSMSDSLFFLSTHFRASSLSLSGNWRQTQSNKDSTSFAKSSKYQSNTFGIISLFFFEIHTDAWR